MLLHAVEPACCPRDAHTHLEGGKQRFLPRWPMRRCRLVMAVQGPCVSLERRNLLRQPHTACPVANRRVEPNLVKRICEQQVSFQQAQAGRQAAFACVDGTQPQEPIQRLGASMVQVMEERFQHPLAHIVSKGHTVKQAVEQGGEPGLGGPGEIIRAQCSAPT